MRDFLTHSIDFFGFAVGAVLAFAAIAVLLPRLRPGARLPRLTWVVLGAVLVVGWWPVEKAGRAERHQIEELLNALAPTYANELTRAGHSRLKTNTPKDDPLFRSILLRLDEWTKSNPVAADIYTMRRRPTGEYVFMADADTDYDKDGQISNRERGAAPGEVFRQKDAGLEQAFDGKANFNPAIVTDRWGSWVGAWAPIFDENGKVDAVLGIDYYAADWLRAIAAARHAQLLALGLLLLAVAASAAAFGIFQALLRERQAAEAGHAAAEQRLRLTLQQMALAFVEIDPKGIITDWNPAAETMFGYSADMVVGKMQIERLVAPDALPNTREIFQTLLQQPLPSTSINDNVTRDGRIIRCEWFNAPVIDPDGKVISIVSLAQDVSERESIADQVRQSLRLAVAGQLAAGIAHNFNNLLTVINGHADLLQCRAMLPDNARADARRILDAGERAAVITRQLLTYGRKQPIFPRLLDLKSTVEAISRQLQRTLGDTIVFETQFDESLSPVAADVSLLEQALMNLALNARDAMPAGGRVRMELHETDVSLAEARANPERRAGRFLQLSVSDTGLGIPPEVLPRIFEPFFTTKPPGYGTGLGLPAVYGIVKQHGGWVEVHTATGQGTTVDLYFPPALEPASSIPPVRTALPGSPASATVLLVDDDATVRNVARLSLERAGYKVMEAEDGPAAEELWSRHKGQIGVLLTDMVMPHSVGGRELADRFLAERPSLPVVFVSGYAAEQAMPAFTESAHSTLLRKPFRPEQLIAAIERVTRDGARQANPGATR